MYRKLLALLFAATATAAPLLNYLSPPQATTPSLGSIGVTNGGTSSSGENSHGTGSIGGAGGFGNTKGSGFGGIGGFSSGREEGAGGHSGAGGAAAGGYKGAGGFEGSGGAGGYGGTSGPFIPIISYENNPNQGDGSYSWSYETGNDIKAQEKGYLNSNAPEGPGESAQGSYSYIAPDGQLISVSYTADENGFVPQGAHIPTPPPVPQEILESLQKNAADEAAGIFDDGVYREEGAGGYGEISEYTGSQGSDADSYSGVDNAGYGGVIDNGISGGFQRDRLGYSYPTPNK